MSVIMGLLVVSALAGLVLGFYFGLAALVAALAVSGLILSISAAMILQKEDFDFPEGVGIIFVVLTVNQIAYLVQPSGNDGLILAHPARGFASMVQRKGFAMVRLK